MSSRYTVFFVSCALPLLLVSQIAPSMAHELDFWLLWVVAMTFVGLPILFAEIALSVRSGALPYQGIQKLTREADAKIIWRMFAGLSVFISLLFAVSITTRLGEGVHLHLPQLQLPLPSVGVSVLLAFVLLILSLLKSRLLPVGVALVVIGSLISLFDGGLDSGVSVPVMTAVSLGEWAKAVSLALICVGVGSGLYWFGNAPNVAKINPKKSLSGMILAIWLSQLVFGSFALLVSSSYVTPTSFAVSGIGMLLVAGFLVYYAGVQLMYRFGWINGAIATLVGLLVLSALPAKIVLITLIVIGMVAVVLLALFAGFAMKISHLRKTFNFKSEARYNLWRMFVRIFAPLAILVALVGWVLEWLR
ncbi:hypothetical protein [Moraxella oblonga]|uniref:hypothetical protein n=1 Tax=Moraxella oblonga TaxID=200413 RepID=UPI00082EF9F3|nr:hypothetical protein [Moraxella oblonga]